MGIDPSPELIEFLCREVQVGHAEIKADTQLQHDLGVDGDDGLDLIEAFARKFGVDFAGFDCTQHFGPEGMPIFSLWLWGRSRPRFIPITVADLEASIRAGKWVGAKREEV